MSTNQTDISASCKRRRMDRCEHRVSSKGIQMDATMSLKGMLRNTIQLTGDKRSRPLSQSSIDVNETEQPLNDCAVRVEECLATISASDNQQKTITSSEKQNEEPRRKRRMSNEGDVVDVSESNEDSTTPSTIIDKPSVSVEELPDPATNVSPDEFLLQLLKAMTGVSFEVKPALSLENFFEEVTEEQMLAYTVQVVGVVRNNDLAGLKKMKEEGQRLDCFNRFGESLLNMACRRGFEEITSYLLDESNLSLRIRDDCGRTPLHDTCWNPSPQLSISKWILEREPSLFLISDRRGCTPFQYARPQHWNEWRQFLFDNRECLRALSNNPNIVSRLRKDWKIDIN